ncbi:MAG: hypothetical protein ACPG19_06095 [Saprospiraceae bacterium]
MQAIQKRKNEPEELTGFKKRMNDGDVRYSDTYKALCDDDKGAFPKFQTTLASEQGFICAYCEQSIKDDDEWKPIHGMKVEHFRPKSIYNGDGGKEDLRIEYTNLLAVCAGREKDATQTHCDTPPNGKDDKDFTHFKNPALWSKLKFNPEICFSKQCNVYSNNDEINKELEDILNLNEQILAENRQRVWKGVKNRINKEVGADWKANKTKARIELNKYLNIYQKKTPKGQYFRYKPFRSCIIYQLEKSLRKFST